MNIEDFLNLLNILYKMLSKLFAHIDIILEANNAISQTDVNLSYFQINRIIGVRLHAVTVWPVITKPRYFKITDLGIAHQCR